MYRKLRIAILLLILATAGHAEMPEGLADTVIGQETAREVGLLRPAR